MSMEQHRGKGVLIISYETQRRYSNIFMKHYQTAQRSKANTDDLPFGVSNNQCCDLLICDEVLVRASGTASSASTVIVDVQRMMCNVVILRIGTQIEECGIWASQSVVRVTCKEKNIIIWYSDAE